MKVFLRFMRRAWLLRQTAFSLAMAAFIYLCVAFQYHPRTPYGTQCPTAPTQKVQVAVMCCGEVVGYELREPKPGETGFMQCHCSEKKTGEGHGASLPPKIEPFLTQALEVQTRAFVTPISEPPILPLLQAEWITPPPVPPPITA